MILCRTKEGIPYYIKGYTYDCKYGFKILEITTDINEAIDITNKDVIGNFYYEGYKVKMRDYE